MISFSAYRPAVLPPAFGAHKRMSLNDKNDFLFQKVNEWSHFFRSYRDGNREHTLDPHDLVTVSVVPDMDRLSRMTSNSVSRKSEFLEKLQVVGDVLLYTRSGAETKAGRERFSKIFQKISVPFSKLNASTKEAFQGLLREVDPSYKLPSS